MAQTRDTTGFNDVPQEISESGNSLLMTTLEYTHCHGSSS